MLKHLALSVLLALAVTPALAAGPVVSTPAPWNQAGPLATLAVTNASANVQLGWVGNASQPPATIIVWNTGSVAAYVLLGTSNSVTATTTGSGVFYVAPGAAPSIAVNGNSFLAAITSTGSTNLIIAAGNGSASATGGASSGGGGGGTMTVTANNAVLPAASRNLGQSYPVLPGGSIQTQLTNAANNGGGTVMVQFGTYTVSGSSLLMSSNTRLVCEPGTVLHTVSTAWSGNHAAIQNIDNTAVSLTDHDIEVDGCTFTEDATFAADGGFHAIQMIYVSRVKVDGNTFTAGGDGSAMIGSADTVVTRNSMTGALNACWDHWNAPANVRVTNNFCGSSGYGILVTGTNTGNTSAGVASGGAITGNEIAMSGAGAQAAIWLNGLGASGSGASGITVAGNYVYGDGSTTFECLRASGGGSAADTFTGNVCYNSTSGFAGAAADSDAGGAASNITFTGNIFSNISVSGGNVGVVHLSAANSVASDNRISGGSYPYAFYISGSNDVAVDNVADAGSSGYYNTTGATNPVILDASNGAISLVAGTPGGFGLAPQGRLTLQSGAPVQNADEGCASTVYYDSYAGNRVPVYNGTANLLLVIANGEISMGLDAVTPHIASGSVYDVFAVNSSGALALCAGPAWSSTTSRGTGAGTTQIHNTRGFWTNQNALTHCWGGASGTTDLGSVAADQASYLGSLYATANGQTTAQFLPAGASGGAKPFVGLYNAYNRVSRTVRSQETAANWSVSSTSTWETLDHANATGSGANNRVTFLDGLQQSAVGVRLEVMIDWTGNSTAKLGIDLDSTSATPATVAQIAWTTAASGAGSSYWPTAEDNFAPQLGLHYAQAMEWGANPGGNLEFGNGTTDLRLTIDQ